MFVAFHRRRWWGLRRLALLGLLLAALPGAGHSEQDSSDRECYYRAVDYCRGAHVFPGSLLLSPDKQVLCFDGPIARDMDMSAAKDLGENGLFVVHSPGGYPGPAMTLSDIVRDRHATVVLHDYCISACAMFFLIASDRTYVLKGTLVAWHLPPNRPELSLCTSLVVPRNGGPRKLLRGPCANGTLAENGAGSASIPFFKNRIVDQSLELPPDTLHVRRIVSGLYAETGIYRDVGWTIHPRSYPGMFKTKIVYEAYPESQDEVDDMLARLHLDWKVIYDP
jgi:hypothetical protein